MARRPFEVAVQGAKPRKSERRYRWFGRFETAAPFAVQQVQASWSDEIWTIQNVQTGERWHARRDGSVVAVF
jgi:hypothetical protein